MWFLLLMFTLKYHYHSTASPGHTFVSVKSNEEIKSEVSRGISKECYYGGIFNFHACSSVSIKVNNSVKPLTSQVWVGLGLTLESSISRASYNLLPFLL